MLLIVAQPWREYTPEDARKEFPQAAHPLMAYFKHLANRYVGEVALVWQYWAESAVGGDPLPRGARMWHPQFARTREQAQTLRGLRTSQNG